MENNSHAASREELIAGFDPNGPGRAGKLFGLPFTPETSEFIIIPVPWEVTVSYGAGTADAPAAIAEASSQIDLYFRDLPEAWKLGVSMLPVPEEMQTENARHRDLAASYIHWLENAGGAPARNGSRIIPKAIDDISEKLNIYVRAQARKWLDQGKMVAVLGGDHSTPLGLIRALAERTEEFGILQIDAHADLREAYEDFTYSHASIMHNVLRIPQVTKLVQVGVRDYCEEEVQAINAHAARVKVYFDEDIQFHLLEGNSWKTVCDSIIRTLPENVYISFDIDGLDPRFCPNTGTPVPGGLDFQQVIYLIRAVVRSGRKIIGFDLVEVCPGDSEWDANVGARLLYNLVNYTAVSQGRVPATN